MVRILIVDDSEMERFRVGKLLESNTDHELLYAEDGPEALKLIAAGEDLDVVLADIFMPKLDGLSLLDKIVEHHPEIPVILMTARGNEEMAVDALGRGAAYYVPKRSDDSVLLKAIDRVVNNSSHGSDRRLLMSFLQEHAFDFQLDNDQNHIPIIVNYLQGLLSGLQMFPCFEEKRIGIAVQEAIMNAMIHGNLEISSNFREGTQPDYDLLVEERLAIPEFASRRVSVTGVFGHDRIEFTIRDEGPGFDPQSVPDPTRPENLLKSSGRGMLMMRHFMDEVVYNAKGNEVRLIKRCQVPDFEETALS